MVQPHEPVCAMNAEHEQPMLPENRYSQHARRALAQAHVLALDYQHATVDTDHLLVGIMREKSSLGYRVLHELGADERRAEMQVRALHDPAESLEAPLFLTEALHKVLALSEEESNWFGHHYVGTEHLLLALARSRAGSASEVLSALTISAGQIRRRVRLLLSDGVTELSLETAKRVARLSELSRRVLNAAGQVAAQVEGQTAGLPHLLLVLAREQRSGAGRLLQAAELASERLALDMVNAPAMDARVQATLLADVIDSAVNRADQLGTHYTGTDHILLALAEHDYGSQLLRTYGVDPDELIAHLMRELDPSISPDD